MNSLNVELITNIMRFIKNNEVVLIKTKTLHDVFEGVIERFDGTNIQLNTGSKVECNDIESIYRKLQVDYNFYVGKRVVIKGSDSTNYDGVVCGSENNSVNIITENGIETIDIEGIVDIQEYEVCVGLQENEAKEDTHENDKVGADGSVKPNSEVSKESGVDKKDHPSTKPIVSNDIKSAKIRSEPEMVMEDESRLRLEMTFKKYRDKDDYSGAKGHFSALLSKHDSDPIYITMNIRAELFYAQYMTYSKSKKSLAKRYDVAMTKWLIEHNALEAERLFMDAIMADMPEKGKIILSYIDMIAVEFGLNDAIKVLMDLQQEIKYCERNEKIAFYEKKYTFAYSVKNIPDALNALETLKTTYYNKTKLGNCWYRTGECYLTQSKWKQAKNSFEKAIEYGYMKNVCKHKIVFCRTNMGEKVDRNSRESFVELDSIEKINARIELYFNDLKYKEANLYIRELVGNYPDNEELIEIAKKVEEIFQRFINNGTSMPKRKDSQAIALRAWHIEGNYNKAKKYFEKEIADNGNKKISCIMDLSELLLHTEGIESAISKLKKYEGDINSLKITDRSGYYEKLYSLYLKNKDINNTIKSLDQLIEIYSKAEKKDKETFSYFRSAIACYQDKRFFDTISRMKKAIDGGYHSNVCYKCIAFSYAYLGQYDKAISFLDGIVENEPSVDSNIQIIIKELREQVDAIRNKGDGEGHSGNNIQEEFEIDDLSSGFVLGFNNRYEAFFVERYGDKPVGISIDKFEQARYRESDINWLEKEAWEHKLRERTGFFGTAAYIENKINGSSYKYYELLRNSANSWGLELQNNGFFDSACACFAFSLENDKKPGKGGQRSALNYLSCVARQRMFSMPDSDGEIEKQSMKYISQIMETDGAYGENVLRELILLIQKSKFIRDVISTADVKEKDIWISQFANYISTSDMPSNFEELFESITKRCWQDENVLFDFTNKVKNSKIFNSEQLGELRGCKDIVFIFDTDVKYIDSLVNAYEKGIEIYDYDDYDNRMAAISNVQGQLNALKEKYDNYPTYFSINFLSEIVDSLQEILSEFSKKTSDDLRPEISLSIPIADVPVVEGNQGISVTVMNKENSASARDVRLGVTDVDGKKLIEDISIAQYLKGGRSVSKEFIIPNQGDNYTIKVTISYVDHQDLEQTSEHLVSISSANDIFEPIKSPYFTGDSIDVSQAGIFVGRDILLDTLENALCNNKSGCQIIYGQKRSGKSSIANFLEERLKDTFLIIKFSIGAARSTRNIYINIRDLVVEKLEDLIDLDIEIDGIDEMLLDEIENRSIEDDEEFVSFMRLVHRKLCKPLKKEILLIIDEFTHLYRYIKEDRRQVAAFMDTWKKLLEADLFKAVLIGQDTMPNFIKEFQNQFQVTQPIRVDRLDDDSVRMLIEEPLRLSNGETRFMENSVDLIASWFYGQPYYIQLYCNRLVEQMNIDKRVRVTNALAEKVKSFMLEEADEDLFDNLISRGDESGTEGECYDILKQIATLTKNSEWADIDEIRIDNKDVLIDDLINRAVIKKKENKCKILISFFREWLNLN